MKQTILLFAMILTGALSFAQSGKFHDAMKTNLALLDSAFQKGNFTEVANNFERIALAEKDQWLPYYWASYATLMQVMASDDKSRADEVADRAEDLIKQAENALGKDNSEISVIKSMVATTRLMLDPMNRWMKYGPISTQHLQTAKELDASNPRPWFLEGQSKLHTPEAFGGGYEAAKPILEKALILYTTFKPESELHPSWGEAQTKKALEPTK